MSSARPPLRKRTAPLFHPHLKYGDMVTPRGDQETVILDADILPTWLLSIQVERVGRPYSLVFPKACHSGIPGVPG